MYIILGLGKTGLSVANYFVRNGIAFAFNETNPSTIPENIKHLGIDLPHHIGDNKIEAIIASPGISTIYNPTNPFVLYAKEKSIPIISDIHLFQKLFPSKKYIAITGTNGKSTTTTLIYEILKSAGNKPALCGNIGQSPFANAIDADICVIEISSFQLEITYTKFDISTIINITPDHLDRYNTLANYKKEKLHIIELSKICIVNQNIAVINSNIIHFSNIIPNTGYFTINNEVYYQDKLLCKFPQTKLLGGHNRENIMSAFAVCHQFGIEIPVITKTIENFNAIEHRIEFVREVNGIKFYNDSKATNIDSTLNALRSIKGSIFLIAGGKLVEDVSGLFENPAFQSVKMIAVIGSAAGIIIKELLKYNNANVGKQIKYCISGNIDRALADLYFHAQKDSSATVLLSPFCKSFDQFRSFEERGEIFKQNVHNL